MKRPRVNLFIFSILSFIVSAAPLAVALALNFESYTKTVSGGVKLTIGGIIVCVLLLFKALGKLNAPGGIMAYFVVFLLAYLLEAILADLILLSGMALLGEVMDMIFIRPFVRRAREEITVKKTADATTKQITAVLDSYLGGRV